MKASSSAHRFALGCSVHADAATGAKRACQQAGEALGAEEPDLAILFYSPHHVELTEVVATIARASLRPRCLIGVSCEGVIAGRAELEGAAAVAVLAARMPGVSFTPFAGPSLFPVDDSPAGLERLGRAVGAEEGLRGVLLFGDPFTVPAIKLLPALNRAVRELAPRPAIVGGMASASREPGGNTLILDGKVYRSGLVGVGISGQVKIDALVSQGCVGIGPNMVITRARGNTILELAGRPALEAMQETLEELPHERREQLRSGLFFGRVVNEYKEHFGRGDYLIRPVVNADEATGSVAVADLVRVGQTVRLHLRDRATAQEDLALLMDAQALYEPPAGCLLISCNGRGTRLFDRPNVDAATVARAFDAPESGADKAKGGLSIEPGAPSLPLAGFHAAGEIGPIGGECYIHGQSACVVMFR